MAMKATKTSTIGVQATDKNGQPVYYTGQSGDGWISSNRENCFLYDQGEARRKADCFNRATLLHGLKFEIFYFNPVFPDRSSVWTLNVPPSEDHPAALGAFCVLPGYLTHTGHRMTAAEANAYNKFTHEILSEKWPQTIEFLRDQRHRFFVAICEEASRAKL